MVLVDSSRDGAFTRRGALHMGCQPFLSQLFVQWERGSPDLQIAVHHYPPDDTTHETCRRSQNGG
jgi:hypothetical protein